jgi:hypothetical protein
MVTDRHVRQLATACALLLALGLGACSSDTKPTDTADTGTESVPTSDTESSTGCRGGARATDSGGSGSDSGGSGATGAPPRAHTGYTTTGC